MQVGHSSIYKFSDSLGVRCFRYVIMLYQIYALWLMHVVHKLSGAADLVLATGEFVYYKHQFEFLRYINGKLVSSCRNLFYEPLKPGDLFLAILSNKVIRFILTSQDLAEHGRSAYPLYKHLESFGVISIVPGLKWRHSESEFRDRNRL